MARVFRCRNGCGRRLQGFISAKTARWWVLCIGCNVEWWADEDEGEEI